MADDHFEGGPDERAIPEHRSRIGLLLVVVLVVAAVVAAFVLLSDDDEDDPADGTTTSSVAGDTSTSAAPAGSTTTAPATLEQPALWPAAGVAFTDPVAAAQDFLDQVLGAGEAGAFRQGDARSGEVDALFRGEDGAQETPLPFTTSLDLSAAAPGDVVTILVQGGTGLETDPGDFGAIPVVIAG